MVLFGLLFLGLCPAVTIIVFTVVVVFCFRQRFAYRKLQQKDEKPVIGFFHPYCNAGGGGERVLWCAIRAIQLNHPEYECVVYTGDCDATAEDILEHAAIKFNITLPHPVKFIFLHKRTWVEAHHYPYFTLLGQGIGSMVLAYEALSTYVPDVFFDSMGYPMSYFVFKAFTKCKIACYVHYPTISTDMLSIVADRTGSFNNRAVIAQSSILTNAKLIYYHLFAWIYGCAGRRCDVIMVNSTWTKGHIENLWVKGSEKPVTKVFPPCDVTGFLDIPLDRDDDIKTILSISQFRPEKNQKLQVQSFSQFLSKLPHKKRSNYRLILAGGCRNKGDEKRIQEIKALAEQLQISQFTEIKVNVPFSELKQLLAAAHIGIHTMNNEHFGIGVVEFQAAGVVALAHNSGGPRMDIVIGRGDESTGFLAQTAEEYAALIEEIFSMSQQQRLLLTKSARKACERFSETQFEADFLLALKPLL